jgi:hypothetical protein
MNLPRTADVSRSYKARRLGREVAPVPPAPRLTPTRAPLPTLFDGEDAPVALPDDLPLTALLLDDPGVPDADARVQKLLAAYQEAKGNGRASDVVSRVSDAAFRGRVATLLLDEDRLLPGILDETTGAAMVMTSGARDLPDILDTLSALVIRSGGAVVFLPAADMPCTSGVAAIFAGPTAPEASAAP